MNQFVFERKRPVVETTKGKLRGVCYGDVNIFMGVPYAHAKRFHLPEEIEPWEGIKDAYRHGPISMHAMEVNPFAYYRGIHVLEKQSEDCQNLNIWAPKDGEKIPVFVWIHGGGFFAGNAFEEISFDGFNTAHYGNVIFISINHRLNICGYTNLEDYGEEFKNSVNAGIWDLIAALKWIHENVAAFGGDPENVTICGHSGGGGKVQCLFQIEEAKDYFQRGICLSGAMGGKGPAFTTRERSRETAKKMLDELGITKENIEKIYEVSYQDLVAACRKVSNPLFFAPVENDFFPGYPTQVGLMPFSKDKPFIYGSVLGEFPICKLTADEKELMDEEARIAYLRNSLGEGADQVMDLFRKAYPDHDILDLAYLDSGARMSAVASAYAHVAAGNENVYLFLGAYTVPEDGQIPIWHGGEVGFIFMNEDKVLALNDPDYGQKYAAALSTMVHNFVKYGDPNNEYLPEWKPVREGKNWTMIVDKECRCVANHDDELMEVYDKVAPKFTLKFD